MAVAQSKTVEERNRHLFVLSALVITVVTGLTDLVQKLNVPVPPLGHIGSVVGPSILVVGVFRYRKAYDVLAQAQMKLEMLSDVARGVSHEIRNPLSAIKGLVNLQADYVRNLDRDKIAEYQGILAEEIGRVEAILSGFQDFSKPLKLETEPVNLNSLIEKTFKFIILEPLTARITLDLAPGVPEIEADPSLLRQAFLNLIKNASEACGSEGSLEISTEHTATWIAVSFLDNGPGFPEEVKDRVFEPFFSTKEAGVGLGLSIVRRIATKLGGEVGVESKPGDGSLFWFTLPAE